MFNIWTDKKNLPTQEPAVAMRPHRLQFIIGSEVLLAHDDWCSRQLHLSTWISYCPELRASWILDADGISWVLLGLAVETLEDKAEPVKQIAQTPSAKVPNLYASWAGRWVLIGGGRVHMDASGLLGCFYGKTSDNQTWVSSSPALLLRVLSPDALPALDSRKLRHEVGLSWFTPPRSHFAGMYRLLPSQVIELQTGSIQPRPLMPPIDPTLGYDETLEKLQQSMVMALRRLPTQGSRLWLSLSAGADSRLVLAMARCADINPILFTRIAARMSIADRLLPPKLAQELGYEHVFLRGQKPQPVRRQLVAEHSAGNVSAGDAEPFIQGVRDSLAGISTGGWCFGVGKVLGRKLLPDRIDDPEVGARQIAQAYGEPLTSTATAGIREWLEWVIQTPQAHLDWRDRFYIEQRLAGWQSAKEQLYDLTKIERFPIINSAYNYALLLGLEESRRLGSGHHVELIRRVAPELLKYPINPPDLYFGIIPAMAIKFRHPLYLYQKVLRKLL